MARLQTTTVIVAQLSLEIRERHRSAQTNYFTARAFLAASDLASQRMSEGLAGLPLVVASQPKQQLTLARSAHSKL